MKITPKKAKTKIFCLGLNWTGEKLSLFEYDKIYFTFERNSSGIKFNNQNQ